MFRERLRLKTKSDLIALNKRNYRHKNQGNLDRLVNHIQRGDYEDACALYVRHHDSLQGKLSRDRFWSLKLFRHVLKWAKRRYYEFFVDLFDEKYREELNRYLYRPLPVEHINECRQALRLDGNLLGYSLFSDRMNEYKILFGVDEIVPVTKNELMAMYDERLVGTNEGLFGCIEKASPAYFYRKLAFLELSILLRIRNIILAAGFTSRARVLDYGCGAADAGIYCARLGHDVTVCDIQGRMIDAAVERFRLRSLPVTAVEATPGDPIPTFGAGFDLIVATEIIEHVRDPFLLLERLDSVLNPGGIIVFGSFPFADTSAVGDHLIEAVSARVPLLEWIHHRWRVFSPDRLGNTFIKPGS